MAYRLYKSRWIILFFVFWLTALLYIPKGFLDLGGDSAQYIILAESIAHGQGYKAVNYPGEPFFYHYPPVFPLLLSPIVYFFGRNLFLMHLLIALLGYASLFILYRIFKKYTEKEIAYIIVVLLATNIVFLSYSAQYILSDIPYLFFSGVALLFSQKYLNNNRKVVDPAGFMSILAIITSYFTRYSGISLFLGLLVIFFISRGARNTRKSLFILSGFMLFFILWNLKCRLYPGIVPSNLKQFILIDPYRPFLGTIFSHPHALVVRFVQGVYYYCNICVDVLFFLKLPYIFSYAMFALIMFGLWVKFREDKSCVFHYYFVIYIIMLALWPYREGVRFIIGILPFLYFYLLSGISEISHILSRKYHRYIVYLTGCIFLVMNVIVFSLNGVKIKRFSEPENNFIEINKWMKDNLPSESIIASRKPTITSFYTKDKAVTYPFTPIPEKFWEEIKKKNVQYIVIDEFSRESYYYLIPFINKYHNKLKLLHKTGNTGVLEILNK